MSQTLFSHFSREPHISAEHHLPPARIQPCDSLEALFRSLQEALKEAKEDLLQPRPQVIARILREATTLR
ncbi:MAG: hypothetical protein JST06_04380 [Bacteroidetes bacterium]|nr:hypothetical protein [Bacteroidota bacterium]MBS1630281.1 hypothetical protein [Bacteroidota bacterium]